MTRPPVEPRPLRAGEEVDRGLDAIDAITSPKKATPGDEPGEAPAPAPAPARRRGRPPKPSNEAVKEEAAAVAAEAKVPARRGRPPNPKGRLAWERQREVEDALYSRDAAVAAEAKGWLSHNILALAETDPDKSFRIFMGALRPLMQKHCPLGEVHDIIIKGLLSEEPATIIITSRNMGKSTIAGMWALWRLYLNPLESVLMVSRSLRGASKNARNARLFLEHCPLLDHLRPNDRCLDSALQFEVPAALDAHGGAPSLACAGLGTTITGMRSSILILDDVETTDDGSPDKLDNVNDRIAELINTTNPAARVIVLGTPHADSNTIYLRLQRDYAYELILAPAVIEVPDEDDPRKIEIKSLWPQRWSPEQLKIRKSKLPGNTWRTQWLVKIEDQSDRRPLRLDHFVVMPVSPAATSFPIHVTGGGPVLPHLETYGAPDEQRWRGPSFVGEEERAYLDTIMSVDTASGLAGHDLIGVVIGSLTAGGSCVIRDWRGVMGTSLIENIAFIAGLAKRFGVTKSVVEETVNSLFGATLQVELEKRCHPCTIEPVKPYTLIGKVQRILQAVEPPLSSGRIILLEEVINSDGMADIVGTLTSLQENVKVFKRRKGVDQIDALGWLCFYFKDSLCTEVGTAIMSARIMDREERGTLPIRRGGFVGVEETFYTDSEDEEQLRADHQAYMQYRSEDIRLGRDDPIITDRLNVLTHAVEALNEANNRLRGGTVRRR